MDSCLQEKVAPPPSNKKLLKIEKAIGDVRLFFEEKSKIKRISKLFLHQFRTFYFVNPPAWRILLRSFSSNKRMLPSFVSTGAIRSGTSSLSNYLLQHPAVLLPLSKELIPIPKLNIIKAQFPLQKEADKLAKEQGMAITGDCTPVSPSASWIYWAKALNPKMKIIIILRNPVDRVISHWQWNKMLVSQIEQDQLWQELPGFEDTMRQEMRDINDGGAGFQLYSGADGSSYLRHSIYLPFIRNVIEQFGAEQVKIIHAQDFFNDPITHAKECYQFLGLADYTPIVVKEKNPSPSQTVSPEIREELGEFFAPYNQKLYNYLGKDFDW